MSSVSHLHKLACDIAFRCTSADLLRCFVLSLCCDDWLDRCGGGSVRVETKSRQHQQYIRVL